MPNEGDIRQEWDYAQDCLRTATFRNGRWDVVATYPQDHQRFNVVTVTTDNAITGVDGGGGGHVLDQAVVGWDGDNRGQWYAERVAMRAVQPVFTPPPPITADADARAGALLLSHLNDNQRHEWQSNHFFTTRGKSGRQYRVHRGVWPDKNVTWIERGRDMVSYCAHPMQLIGSFLPNSDVVLAQKLALETDDMQFTRTACSTVHHPDAMQDYVQRLGLGNFVEIAPPPWTLERAIPIGNPFRFLWMGLALLMSGLLLTDAVRKLW